MDLKLLLLLMGLCAVSCHQEVAENEQVAVADTQKESDPKVFVASNAENEKSEDTDDNDNQGNDNQSNNDESKEENSDFSDVEDPDTGESDLSEKDGDAETALAKNQGMFRPLHNRNTHTGT